MPSTLSTSSIGCGLAGGDWPTYRDLLEAFARTVALKGCTVTLYKYTPPPQADRGKRHRGRGRGGGGSGRAGRQPGGL